MKSVRTSSLKNASDLFWKRLAILLKDDHLDTLHGWKKAKHILTYYKFALVILCIFIYFIGFNIYRHFTYKDVILYTALVNVTAGETLTRELNEGFMTHSGMDSSKSELVLYTGLYLTDDELNEYHEYSYASRMKILAALEGQLMDVVLMNREAFDAFSQNGYLYDLEQLLMDKDPTLYEMLQPYLVGNIVILEDNANDLVLDDSIPYTAVTQEVPFGLDISEAEVIRQAGFKETVYLGVIANSPRTDTVITYLRYLMLSSDSSPSTPKQSF